MATTTAARCSLCRRYITARPEWGVDAGSAEVVEAKGVEYDEHLCEGFFTAQFAPTAAEQAHYAAQFVVLADLIRAAVEARRPATTTTTRTARAARLASQCATTRRIEMTDLERSEQLKRKAERLERRAMRETNPAKCADLYQRAEGFWSTAQILQDRYFGWS
jgi:hypothetical protein